MWNVISLKIQVGTLEINILRWICISWLDIDDQLIDGQIMSKGYLLFVNSTSVNCVPAHT